MLKYHNFASIWGLTPRPYIWDCLLDQTRTPLLKSLRTGLHLPFETACSPAASCPNCAIHIRPLLIKDNLQKIGKTANVLSIFKKGNRSLPSNYRPISLTSICCKIMEHIVYSNILNHLQRHNIFCEEQHGFRSGRSCETQLLNIIDDHAKHLDDRKQTDVILLDFSKVFDKVPHHRLCLKLSHYGIHGCTLFWIENLFLLVDHNTLL